MKKLEKRVSAVLVAAGSSTRMGFDKLSFDLGGETVLHRSIRAFEQDPLVTEIVLVAGKNRAFVEQQAADCTKPVDFGEGKKSIYALEGAQVLVQRDKEVQMAVNEFGAGRAVYLSGLPYSFENSRILYRSILWSTHDEQNLHRWFSSNFNVEVHAYVKNGKYCVVNNTYEPQHTTVYTGDGASFELDMAANEIRWFEI